MERWDKTLRVRRNPDSKPQPNKNYLTVQLILTKTVLLQLYSAYVNLVALKPAGIKSQGNCSGGFKDGLGKIVNK